MKAHPCLNCKKDSDCYKFPCDDTHFCHECYPEMISCNWEELIKLKKHSEKVKQ